MAKTEWDVWHDEIRRAAVSRCPAWLHALIPGGSVRGAEFVAASVNGGAGDSLKIRLVGERAGWWKDWASGEKGGTDLISLYMRVRGIGYKEASDELAAEFNIDKPRILKAAGTWDPIIPIPDFAPVGDDGLPPWPVDSLPFPPGAEIAGYWCYLDREGNPTHWRVRVEEPSQKKNILPLTFCRNSSTGATAWRWRDVPSPRPLYGLEWLEMMPDAPVLIVSGEKTADAARRLLPDWVVVTNPGGDDRVGDKYTDWSPVLARETRRVIWPDADESGIRAAAKIAMILDRGCQVVQPDSKWRQGWDLADGEAEGWDAARVFEWIEHHSVTAADAVERPAVNISGADLEDRSQAIWEAIKRVNEPPVMFTLNGRKAFVDGLGVHDADSDYLRYWLTHHFRFQRNGGESGMVSCSPDDRLVRNLLVFGDAPIPKLRRIVSIPVLAPDGRLIARPGYDRTSGIYYLPEIDVPLPDAAPRQAEVAVAVALIDDLLHDFPFADDASRAHAIAIPLTAIARETITGPTPMFLIEAPAAGTGKGTLMDVLCELVNSENARVRLPDVKDDEEYRKRITSALAAGKEVITIDNATELRHASLKAALTANIWTDRLLGTNNQSTYPVRCLWVATANNPVLDHEMQRRTLSIRLDAGMERPEDRDAAKFRHPKIYEYVKQAKAELVAAFVTIARAAANTEDAGAPAMGSYESFSRRISAILKRAGIKGFLENREAQREAASLEDSAITSFVAGWAEQFGRAAVTTTQLLEVARNTEGFWLGRSDSDRAQIISLAKTLERYRAAVVAGYRLVCQEPHGHHGRLWRLDGDFANAADVPTDPDEAEIPF